MPTTTVLDPIAAALAKGILDYAAGDIALRDLTILAESLLPDSTPGQTWDPEAGEWVGDLDEDAAFVASDFHAVAREHLDQAVRLAKRRAGTS